MNSSEWQDKEIDELFQSSAQAFEPPAFDPTAWERMEQKLSTFASLQAWYRGVLGGTLSVLLVLLLFVGFQYPEEKQPEELKGSLIQITETDELNSNPESTGTSDSEMETEIPGRDIPVANNDGIEEIDTPEEDPQPPVLSIPEDREEVIRPNVDELPQHSSFSMAFAPPMAHANGEDIRFAEPASLSLEEIPQNEPEEIIPQKKTFSRWGLGALIAPDLSSVGLKNFTSPGTNLGLTVEYRISPRFSLSTGLIYGIKKYDTEGDEYTVPPGFWDGNPAPDLINAQCDVIDIPINISYRIYQGPKSVFSVSTGLSSYFMLSEEYEYEVGTIYNQSNSWSVENENQHFFGIYNISVAYARPLNEQLYFQVEPFMKVPISEIGFGEVDLNSTGVMFSLRYWLKNKR